MQMSWQTEKTTGDHSDPQRQEDEDARPNGFQVRDLVRFFAVDITLVAALKLLLGLGVFSTPDAYVMAILASKIVLFAYLVWLIQDRRNAWFETGITRAGKWWAWPAMAAIYAVAYYAVAQMEHLNQVLMTRLYEAMDWVYTPQPQDVIVLIFDDIINTPLRVVLVAFTVLIGPFMEELAFRGMGLDAFRRVWSVFSAVVWTSLLFGLYHFSLPLLLPLSFLGAVFAAARLLSGSLWCAVAVHCLHNTLALAVVAKRMGMLDWVELW